MSFTQSPSLKWAAMPAGSAVQMSLSQTGRRLGDHAPIVQELGVLSLSEVLAFPTAKASPVACYAEATAEIIMTSSLFKFQSSTSASLWQNLTSEQLAKESKKCNFKLPAHSTS